MKSLYQKLGVLLAFFAVGLNAYSTKLLVAPLAPTFVDCSYSLSSSGKTISYTGGSAFFVVESSPDTCSWFAQAGCNFVSLTKYSGKGRDSIKYTVAINTGSSSRSCNIYVAGQIYRIVQESQGTACTYAIQAPSKNFGLAGGAGSFVLSTNPTCNWVASASCPYVLVLNKSGSGAASINYTVQANTGPARTCYIEVGGQKHTIFQEGQGTINCTYSIDPKQKAFGTAAGAGDFNLSASGNNCTWTASASCQYVKLSTANSGAGSSTVSYSIEANTGPARTCYIEIAGQKHTITQEGQISANCTYSIDPKQKAFGSSGGYGTFNIITSNPACKWTASASCNFVTIKKSSGSGNDSISYSVAANTGPARTCYIEIAGQKHTITQEEQTATNCTYSIDPKQKAFGTAAGAGDFTLSTNGNNCTWTASASCQYVKLSTANSGAGSSTVSYSIEANTGPARTCYIEIAGQKHTITQEGQISANCTYSIDPKQKAFASSGGYGKFNIITSNPACKWTASASCNFVTIKKSSGSGNDSISYSVAANTGPARTCYIEIAGQKHMITQEEQTATNCTYSIDPKQKAFGTAAGAGDFTLSTNGNNCTWTASASCQYVKLSTANSGAGSSTVSYSIEANTGPARTCYIEIAGQKHMITQEGQTSSNCTYSIDPKQKAFGSSGGNGSFRINTSNPSCTWTLGVGCNFVSTNKKSGSGNDTISYSVAANTGPARTCYIEVGGQKHTITQEGKALASCTYAISPAYSKYSAAKAYGKVKISTLSPNCYWTAKSTCTFVTLQKSSGNGSDSIAYSISENTTGETRTCKMEINGTTHYIVQERAEKPGDCAISISPEYLSFENTGGYGAFAVNAKAGCSWKISTDCNFITLNKTNGTGSDSVFYKVDANPSAGSRYCVVKIDGKSHAVLQGVDAYLATNIANIAANEILIYPNPANDILNIELGSKTNAESTINLYNSMGALVLSTKTTEGKTSLSVAGLPKGIYLINIAGKGQTSKMRKVILN